MKIYIDWDRAEWYTDEKQFFDMLVNDGSLPTYSDYLADAYADELDKLLILTEEEKIGLRERYENSLKEDFEERVKCGMLSYTVLNVETKDELTVNQIL